MSNDPGIFSEPPQHASSLSLNHVSAPRIQSLDVLRAIALLGALLVSIWWFGGFGFNKQLQLQLHPHGLNYRLYAAITLLFEGKMLSLISLVFGAGMIIYLTRPGNKSLQAPELFIKRQMWLIGFGLINALLFLWTNDMLFHLGIMGILLFPFFRLSPRALLIAAIVVTLIFCGKNYWRYADDKKTYNKYLVANALDKKITNDSIDRRKKDSLAKLQNLPVAKQVKKDTLTKEQKKDKQAWEGLLKNKKYDPKKDSGENKEMWVESYGKIWNHLLPETQWREAQWTYAIGIWDISGMMLLGMALFKFGFFSSRFSRKQYVLIAFVALAIGILLGLFRMYYNISSAGDYEKYIKHYWYPHNLFIPLEKAFTALGYASVVMALLPAKLLTGLWSALSCVGRMALTNYLLQSVTCSLFFTGYGMGYFGRLPQYQLYIFVAEIWAVQIVFSILWFRRFSYGPAEWLWRCLTYRKRISLQNTLRGQSEPPVVIS